MQQVYWVEGLVALSKKVFVMAVVQKEHFDTPVVQVVVA